MMAIMYLCLSKNQKKLKQHNQNMKQKNITIEMQKKLKKVFIKMLW